jgi:hypothetical protein
MSRSAVYLLIAYLAIFAGCFSVAAQGAEDRIPRPLGERRDGDTPATFKEMLSKQRILRNRKDFEEMQRRGDEALKLSVSLEQSFEQTQSVSGYDRDKLVELERIVKKIREELGGDDDGRSDEREPEKDVNSVQQAFKSLKETTVSLVDELKKTTRFTISASAIQTSNTALKIIRFLRLKK